MATTTRYSLIPILLSTILSSCSVHSFQSCPQSADTRTYSPGGSAYERGNRRILNACMASPRLRVVGGVALRNNCVFMAQRPEGKSDAGLWEFPGGKVEAGESDQDALRREIREELCIDIDVGRFVAKGENDKVDLYCYEIEMKGDPVLAEHAACRWVKLSELEGIPVPRADVAVVSALLSPPYVAHPNA